MLNWGWKLKVTDERELTRENKMKVTKAQSDKAKKYLCACVPMVLCAFQIEFDLD